jgi:hypothetical protein
MTPEDRAARERRTRLLVLVHVLLALGILGLFVYSQSHR